MKKNWNESFLVLSKKTEIRDLTKPSYIQSQLWSFKRPTSIKIIENNYGFIHVRFFLMFLIFEINSNFYKKRKEKWGKMTLEWCLPGTALLMCWQSISIPAPLLVNRLQAVAPHTANSVQAMAPLLVHSIGTVPYRWPKHKKNDGSSKKRTRSRQILLDWAWKQSIKDQNDSDLNRSGSFKPKWSKSESRFD